MKTSYIPASARANLHLVSMCFQVSAHVHIEIIVHTYICEYVNIYEYSSAVIWVHYALVDFLTFFSERPNMQVD